MAKKLEQTICHYRQQWVGAAKTPSRSKQQGRRKRWREQLYRPGDPQAEGLKKNKSGYAFLRVTGKKDKGSWV